MVILVTVAFLEAHGLDLTTIAFSGAHGRDPDKCRVFGGSSGSTGRSGGSSAGKAGALPNSSSFLSGGVLPLAWIDRVQGLRFRV